MPRQPSQDSLLDPESQQFQHVQQLSRPGSRPMLRTHPSAHYHHQLDFYAPQVADDTGLDEFDVADERLHLFGE